MESILASKPSKIVASVLNREISILIFKQFPLGYRGWVYLYCTKDRRDLCYKCINGEYDYDNWKVLENRDNDNNILNGKVVARFYCDNVEEIKCSGEVNAYFSTNSLSENELQRKSCLGYDKLFNYLKPKCDWEGYIEDKIGYAIHISQLEIFDKPKELSEFYRIGAREQLKHDSRVFGWEQAQLYMNKWFRITKAPQSWLYVEENL